MGGKIVLFGLDGADWKILNPLVESGCLPNFKKVIAGGSHARLASTMPPCTPPAWTTIFTGTNPGKHGVLDFSKFVDGKLRFIDGRDRRLPMIWELLAEKKFIAFNIPFSHPVKKADNSNVVCGFPTPGSIKHYTYPESLKEEILGLVPDYEVESPVEIANKDRKAYLEAVRKNLRNKKIVAKHLLENKEWDAAFLVFSSPDWLQHYFISEFFSSRNKEETSLAHVYKSLDDFLGYLLEKNYDIIIVSDHGFREIKRQFAVNSYLRKNGLLAMKRKSFYANLMRKLGVSRDSLKKIAPLARIYSKFIRASRGAVYAGRKLLPADAPSIDDIDHEKSEAFIISNQGGTFVKSNDSMEKVISLLKDARDPEGKTLIRGIVRREDALWGEAAAESPDFFVLPENDVSISTYPETPVHLPIDPVTQRNGLHDNYGIFISYGPNLKGRGKMEDLSVLDITPTFMTYLGSQPPRYMDGRLIPVIEAPGKLESSLKSETRKAIGLLKKKMR